MKTLSLLAIVATVAALVGGCAGTSSPASAASGPPANVAGTWTGGTVGPGGASVRLVLQQTGSQVTGSIDVGGRPEVTGPLTGTVSGNAVAFKLQSGYASTGALNVSGDVMTGVVGGSGVSLRRQ